MPTPAPENIDLGGKAGQGIRIDWSDGHRSVYPNRLLRLACPCAHCVEEMTGRPLLDPDSVSKNVMAVDHMMIGAYAVEFLWSDTHYTGLYTYELLRSLCSCMSCLAAAGNQPKDG